MRQRHLARRLSPPLLVSASILAGWGCGIVNPSLLGGNAAAQTKGIEGNIVILVINNTTVDAQANVTVTKTETVTSSGTGTATSSGSTVGSGTNVQGTVDLNIPGQPKSHSAVVQDCSVNTIQVTQASYAGTAGAVVIPSAVSPVQVGLSLQCGGVVTITISGAPPNVFLNVQSF
jgi:hypothetical protein